MDEKEIQKIIAEAVGCEPDRVGVVMGTNVVIIAIHPTYQPQRGSSTIRKVREAVAAQPLLENYQVRFA